MKPLAALLLLLAGISAGSCKKLVEDKKRDLLIDAITKGKWIVEDYTEAGVDRSIDFMGYEFSFEENGTVTGVYSGGAASAGTWTGDIGNASISANFPAASDPVSRLNGTWNIYDSYWDYVKARRTVDGITINLNLRKK